MASIADVYVDVIPTTAKIADGIKKALLSADDDVRKAAKRWQKEIEAELKDTKIRVGADTAEAEKKIDKAAEDRSATVEVDADTAAAEAAIDRLERDRTVHLNVDVDRDALGRTAATLGPSLTGSAVGAGASFGSSFVSGIAHSFAQANLGAVGMAALVPIAVGGGAIVASTVGVLSLIPAAVGGAVTALGTLALATWRGRRIQCGSVRRRRGVRRVTRDPDTRRPAGRARDPKHLRHSCLAAAADGVCELHRLTVEMH